MRILLSLLCLTTLLFTLSFIPPGGKKRKFIDPANMDLSVRPGDNFYLHANGTWIKNNPVPPSKTRWGSFDQLHEDNLVRLRTLLETAAAGADKDPRMQKIGDLYLSGMDSAALETLGYQPIRPDLDRIAAITDTKSILKEIAYERSHGIANPLIGFFV
jgi:putative endopeptidase